MCQKLRIAFKGGNVAFCGMLRYQRWLEISLEAGNPCTFNEFNEKKNNATGGETEIQDFRGSKAPLGLPRPSPPGLDPFGAPFRAAKGSFRWGSHLRGLDSSALAHPDGRTDGRTFGQEA